MQMVEYRGKYGKLGFDPKGCMLRIGKCGGMVVWLAMAPSDFADDTYVDVAPGYVSGDTRLKTSHYRILMLFLAQALSSLPDRGFTCNDPYEMDVFSRYPDWVNHTNIMYVSKSHV